MNVTLSVDAKVVAAVRRVAAARGTTLEQMIRDFLQGLAPPDDVEETIRELEKLWAQERGRSEGPWTREELHERS